MNDVNEVDVNNVADQQRFEGAEQQTEGQVVCVSAKHNDRQDHVTIVPVGNSTTLSRIGDDSVEHQRQPGDDGVE